MKKLALVLMFALIATSAFGQAGWRSNNIGLYLDLADQDSWCDTNAGAGIFHVWIVGTNMSALSCKGVEFNLLVERGGIANLVFPPGIDLGGLNDTDHTIAYYNPEPIVNGQFVFAEFDLGIFTVTGPTLGFIGPVYYNSLPDPFPAYLDGEDPTLETIIQLNNSIGDVFLPDTELPVLVLNGDCGGVPTEDATWGDVKALFQ